MHMPARDWIKEDAEEEKRDAEWKERWQAALEKSEAEEAKK
jgi:hypothetical protein